MAGPPAPRLELPSPGEKGAIQRDEEAIHGGRQYPLDTPGLVAHSAPSIEAATAVVTAAE